MRLSDQKLSLIERLMRVRRKETLEEVEELLVRAEMESRAEESIEAIGNKDVVSLKEFTHKNHSWLNKTKTSK